MARASGYRSRIDFTWASTCANDGAPVMDGPSPRASSFQAIPIRAPGSLRSKVLEPRRDLAQSFAIQIVARPLGGDGVSAPAGAGRRAALALSAGPLALRRPHRCRFPGRPLAAGVGGGVGGGVGAGAGGRASRLAARFPSSGSRRPSATAYSSAGHGIRELAPKTLCVVRTVVRQPGERREELPVGSLENVHDLPRLGDARPHRFQRGCRLHLCELLDPRAAARAARDWTRRGSRGRCGDAWRHPPRSRTPLQWKRVVRPMRRRWRSASSQSRPAAPRGRSRCSRCAKATPSTRTPFRRVRRRWSSRPRTAAPLRAARRRRAGRRAAPAHGLPCRWNARLA